MARKQVVVDVLADDLDGSEVTDPQELFRCFVGINGTVYQLDLTRKNMTAMQTANKKYIDAAKKLGDENVKEDAFKVDTGFTRLAGVGFAASSAANTNNAQIKKDVEDLVKDKFWAKNFSWATKGQKVKAETTGMKPFLQDVGVDAGSSRIAMSAYLDALKKANEEGGYFTTEQE